MLSNYTTGEIAKLCGISVRTVQYYDTRKLLEPSSLSEGGRRLYSEEDLRQMKMICFLREAGLSIDSIAGLFAESDPQKAIAILLEQKSAALRKELEAQQKQLELVEDFRRHLQNVPQFSLDSIEDIADVLEAKPNLRRLRIVLILCGLPLNLLQWGAFLLILLKGIWWPLLLWICLALPLGVLLGIYYFRRVAYICPSCHTVFIPGFKEAFFANHTPTLRKLTCTHCGSHGFCVETYRKEKTK